MILTTNKNKMETKSLFFAICHMKYCKIISLWIALMAIFFLSSLTGGKAFAQNVGINATGALPNTSAGLDVDFTNKGLLIPRVALTGTGDVTTIAGVVTSLLVYNTATAGSSPTNVVPGYYYWNGTKWISLSGGSGGNDWSLLGNAGTTPGTAPAQNFIGTTDNKALVFAVNNQMSGLIDNSINGKTYFGFQAGINNTAAYNTFIGYYAGNANTSGANNTATGYQAFSLNSTGNANTANGFQALNANTNGVANTAIGYMALNANTTGQDNTAVGAGAMLHSSSAVQNTACGENALYWTTGINNTGLGCYAGLGGPGLATGTANTAVGVQALFSYTSGSNNTATGANALYANTTGYENTAIGTQALSLNIGGYQNTAIGMGALYNNSTGFYNTASGWNALYNNTTGWSNTANGYWALNFNTSGNCNAATGLQALYSNTVGNYNTANGWASLFYNTNGSNNTALGYEAFYFGASFNDATAIGYFAQPTASFQVYLGDASVSQVSSWAGLYNASDARFKNNVEETVPGLSFITKLRPVTYHYDMDNIAAFLHTPDSLRLKEGELLKSKILYSGFIAQEVEKAANEIGYDFNGISKPKNDKDYYAIDYASFVVPLVKAIQELNSDKEKLNIIINSLQTKNDEQEKINQELHKQLDEIKGLIKK